MISSLDDLDGAQTPAEKMKIFALAMAKDWRSFCAELRAKRPILELPPFVFVSRWADVIDVLGRPETFRVPYGEIMRDTVGAFMLGMDGSVENWRDRGLMQALLRWSDVSAIRAKAGEVAKEALDAATQAGRGTLDIVAVVSRLVPLKVVQHCFGFVGPSDAEMLLWSRNTQAGIFHNDLENDVSRRAACVEAGSAMRLWLDGFLDRNQPWDRLRGDDVLSRLLRAHAAGTYDLDAANLISNICGLLVGSIETTSAAIVHSIQDILGRPEQADAAREAAETGETAGFAAIVWEALRFNPIAPFIFRSAATAATLAPGSDHETRLEPGRRIAVGLPSAMFEASVFDEPETFKPRPRNAYLHFGHGSHACLGQHVGYEIVIETVRQVMRIPGLRLQDGGGSQIDRRGGPFPEAFTLAYGRV